MYPRWIRKLIPLAACGLLSACGGERPTPQYGCTKSSLSLAMQRNAQEEPYILAPLTGCASSAMAFSAGTKNLPTNPVIDKVEPLSALVGRPVTLTIHGRSFGMGAKVKLGNQEATSIGSDKAGNLVATFPAQPGLVDFVPVEVRTKAGKIATGKDLFSFHVAPLPTFFGSPAAGGDPVQVSVADFDSDGIVDVVTSDMSDPSRVVSYLFPAVAPGTFPDDLKALAITNPSWLDPTDHPEFNSQDVGDFNEDKRPDLVLAQGTSGEIRFMFNKGDGSFPLSKRMLIGDRIGSVVVGDLDGDKHQDVVAVDTGRNELTVLLGKGDGTFALPQVFPVGNSPFAVTLADLNSDTHLDAVVTNLDSNDISLLFGDGFGGFAAETRRSTCTEPRSVAVADLDGDTVADIVTGCPRATGVQILFGRTMGHPDRSTFIPIAGLPYGVALADFDGDSNLDIAVGNAKGYEIAILRNRRTAKGEFESPVAIAAGFLHGGTAPFMLTTADVNKDGLPDIITANLRWGGIGLILSSTH